MEPAGRAGKVSAFVFGEWLVEPQRGQLQNDRDVRKLEPKAMDVLVLLLEHAGEVVSTNQILESVWKGRVVEEGAVHQKMSQIRAALGDHRERPTYIESIPRRGYRTLQSVKVAARVERERDRDWRSRSRAAVLLATAAVVVGVVAYLAALGTLGERVPPAESMRVRQLTIDLPPQFSDPQNLSSTFGITPVDIAPDASQVVFHGNADGKSQLYARQLATLDVVPIAGTEGAAAIFDISPNGAWLAFVDATGWNLKKVPITGGTPTLICDPDGKIETIHWGTQDKIVFDTDAFDGLFGVSAAGGTPHSITSPENGTVHKHPHLLPDGKTVLLTIGTRGATIRRADKIAAVSLETRQQRPLLPGASAQFVLPATIIYYQEGALWAVEFNSDRVQVESESLPLVDRVRYDFFAHYNLSTDGTLVYVTSSELADRNLVWVDLEGREHETGFQERPFAEPRISPQGDRIVVVVEDKNGADLWLYELDRGTSTRLTFDESREAQPVWMPDGQEIIYSSNRVDDLFRLSTTGVLKPEQLTYTPSYEFASFVTPDGAQVLVDYYGAQAERNDVGILSLDSGSFDPLLNGAYMEIGAALSPNQDWIAYASTRSGRNEVYMRPYPNVADGLWRVSKDGGQQPVWGSDHRLFYWGRTHMMSVAVEPAPGFELGRPESLFPHQSYMYRINRLFDLDRSNNRFLMVKKPQRQPSRSIVIVDNWPELLSRAATARQIVMP